MLSRAISGAIEGLGLMKSSVFRGVIGERLVYDDDGVPIWSCDLVVRSGRAIVADCVMEL